ASILGFRWSSNEASGLQSIVWRKQWEDARDEMIKTKLLEYNQDDCLALRVLTEFIALIKNREVLAEAQHALPNKVVFTSDLVSSSNNRHRFGKIQFCLPDFELVNKCAYYD